MEVTSLSLTARKLRDHLLEYPGLNQVNILIGNPSTAYKEAEGYAGEHYLNIFFYRITPAGYPVDGQSSDPFFVRLYCLITALGKESPGSNPVMAGENDLRLIGGVMDALHTNPVMLITDEEEAPIVQLEIVPHTLELEDLNHIWSTQGDIAYRPSVSYEIAVAPVPLPADKTDPLEVLVASVEVEEGVP